MISVSLSMCKLQEKNGRPSVKIHSRIQFLSYTSYLIECRGVDKALHLCLTRILNSCPNAKNYV